MKIFQRKLQCKVFIQSQCLLFHIALRYLVHPRPRPTFQGSPLAESEPLQAAVCFSQAEEDAVGILSGSTEQQRGRRQLRVTLILYTHWHLHLSLRDEGA